MNGPGLTFAAATLALVVTAVSGVAEPASRFKKCDDAVRDHFQPGDCINPTLTSRDRGPCMKGCYRSGAQKHKKTKT